jgi:Saxitoxin biosynthesis operon protein SxtJ
MASHETLQAHRTAKLGSNRSFGLVFAGFFTLVSLWPLLRHGPLRLWALALAIVFLIIALAAADWLAPLNRIWFKIGLALHTVVSPVILGVLYFAIVVPFGQVLRWRGQDPLRLKQSDAETYWIVRDPAGPEAGAMTKQF